jgi:hypothetical protein
MTIAQYAKKQGINKIEEYETLKNNIHSIAAAQYAYMKSMYNQNGLYHPINEIFPMRHDTDQDRYYIILDELKTYGVEFYHDNIDGLMFRM